MTCISLLVLFGVLATGIGIPHDYYFDIEKGSKLFIEGSSNVNSFECESKDEFLNQLSRITFSDDERSLNFTSTSLRLRTTLLDCDNSKMNRDLCEALKSEDYPYITIELHDAVIIEGSPKRLDSNFIVRCSASMSITNVTRKVSLDVKAKNLGNGRFRFYSTTRLLMTDYGVEPPTALLGLIKVRNSIRIVLDITTRAR